MKLKVLKHSWIGIGISATPKYNALIQDKFDGEIKNANGNGEYDDDHAKVSALNMKKMIRTRKEKRRRNTKRC